MATCCHHGHLLCRGSSQRMEFKRFCEAFVLEKLHTLVFVKIRFRSKDRGDGNLSVDGSSGVWIDFRGLLLDHPHLEVVNGVWGDNSHSVTTRSSTTTSSSSRVPRPLRPQVIPFHSSVPLCQRQRNFSRQLARLTFINHELERLPVHVTRMPSQLSARRSTRPTRLPKSWKLQMTVLSTLLLSWDTFSGLIGIARCRILKTRT